MALPIQELAENYIKNQTKENFNILYKRTNFGIKNYLMSLLNNCNLYLSQDEVVEITNDICQEVYLKALLKIDQYKDLYNFSTWIYRIARNEFLQFVIKRKKDYKLQIRLENNQNQCFQSLNDVLEYNNAKRLSDKNSSRKFDIYDLCEEIKHSISSLSFRYRNILLDREIDGLSYKEIAEKNDVDMQTVKNRIRLGRKILEKKFKKVYEELINEESF